VFLIKPFALAIDLQACAVDQKVQWLGSIDPLRQDRQTATSTAQRGVIGDCDVNFEHVGDRSEQTLGLS
jgi:hypothetical protein